MSQSSSESSETTHALHECIFHAVRERCIVLHRQLAPDIGSPVSFADAWSRFIDAVEDVTGEGIVCCKDHEQAWVHFGPVFSNTYDHEADFGSALFDALKKSLAGVCIEADESTLQFSGGGVSAVGTWKRKMRLGNTNVGFATEFYRNARRSFPDEYAISSNSKADHACVVFREQESVLPKKKSRPPPNSQNSNQETGWQCDDMTAIVELKLDTSSCYECNGNGGIDLRRKHGPIGIALMNVMEVWPCLARRLSTSSCRACW
jgi:hypothetical protein